jgi:hypothetical protein
MPRFRARLEEAGGPSDMDCDGMDVEGGEGDSKRFCGGY